MIEVAEAIKPLPSEDVEALLRENQSLKESLAAVLKDSVEIFNLLSKLAQDEKILSGRQLADLSTRANNAVQAEDDLGQKVLLCNAFIKKHVANIKTTLKTRPPAASTEDKPRPQAITKIQLRAVALVDHVKDIAMDCKTKIAFTSRQARDYLAGVEGRPVSRRDALRALQRASKLCPAIDFESIPNDHRGTKRLILDTADLAVPEMEERSSRTMWQRSRACDVLPWLASG
jgi:hypothetical protein